MKGTTHTLLQRRQGLHFFHNQVVFFFFFFFLSNLANLQNHIHQIKSMREER